VVTGFGRIGHWFASFDEYGVQPDIICCAKGLSSGYQPIGAVIFSDEIWQAISGDRWFTNGFTYAGHPVACAASLKNIEIMEREDLLENARTVGAYFQEGLASLRDIGSVVDTRGIGLIGCVESAEDGVEGDIGKLISDVAETHGLMVRLMGANNVMSPPLTITREQVDFVIDTLRKSILEVNERLVA
ncbi:MAG: aminotransferase class III-fold pyridoxal phosphate-dependent enzyme, partial [Pseudomonadota bacterium]